MRLLKGITYKPLATANQISIAKEWLVTNRPNFKAICNYAVIYGDKIHTCTNHACHAEISYLGRNYDRYGGMNKETVLDRAVVATDNLWVMNKNSPTNKPSTSELYEPYLRYLLNESYASQFILNRDDIDFCREHGFVVSCDAPASVMQNVLIMTRGFIECSHESHKFFAYLLDKGLNPDVAYPVCFTSNLSLGGSGDWDSVSKQAVTSYTGHRAHGLFSLSSMKNFVNHTAGKAWLDRFSNKGDTSKTNYRQHMNYSGGTTLFNDTNLYSPNHFIQELVIKDKDLQRDLAKYRKVPVKRYKPPNPFVKPDWYRIKATPSPEDMTWQEFKDVLVPFLVDRQHDLFKL